MASNLTTQQSASDDSATVFVPTTEWISQWGTVNREEVKGMTTDSEGNIYITGYIIKGEPYPVDSPNELNAFVATYNKEGDRLWTKEIVTDDFNISNGVAVDGDGNIYITGGTKMKIDASNGDGILAKYDKEGNQVWVRKVETSGAESSNGVAVDSEGNIYITGTTSESNIYIASDDDAWVAKYGSNGDRQWLQELSATGGEAYSNGIAADSEGNIYIAGRTTGALPGNTSAGQNDAWIAKYGKEGNRLWIKQYGTQGYESSDRLTVDKDGNSYIQGDFGVAKYDAQGNQLWLKQGLKSPLVVDSDGNFYSPNAKYDPEGNKLWEKQWGNDRSTEVAIDNERNLYVSGTTDYNLYEMSMGEVDAWIAKVGTDTNAVPTLVNNKKLVVDEGESATITNEFLQVTDVEGDTITYSLDSLPTSGIIKNKNYELGIEDTFTQADIDAGNIAYIQDGENTVSQEDIVVGNAATTDYGKEIAKDSFRFNFTDQKSSIINGSFEIAINPVNDVPRELSLLTAGVESNSANGTFVGFLTTVDPDSDAHTYTLVDDAGGRFAIDGDRLIVANGALLDSEVASEHDILVRTTDNDPDPQSLEKTFSVSITGAGATANQWIQQLGTAGNEEANEVTVDEKGNVYVVGTTEKDLAGTNAGGKDLWVAKYDPSGTRLWINQWGTVDNDSALEVDVDTNGNVYIVGEIARTQQVNGYEITETDGFIVKYDSSGNREWEEKIATSALSLEYDGSGNGEWIEIPLFDLAHEVAVDSAGNIYVAGTAGDLGVGAFEGNGLDDTGPFLAKYNPNGDRLWLKQEASVFGNLSIIYKNLTIDGEDNVYLAKKYHFWESAPTTSIIKYDSNGNEEWNQNLERPTNNYAEGLVSNGIAVDSAGNVYVSGENEYVYWYHNAPDRENRAVLTKLDSSGNQQWQNVWSGSTEGVGVDSEGNVYVPVPQGINKYDPEGNLLWEQQLKSSLSSYSDLELDGDGQAYLVGGELEPWLAKLDLETRAIASSGLTLDEGATSTITGSNLQAIDAGDSNYVVTALPSRGTLKLNDIEVVLNDTFTQADIDGGKLTYTHDGSNTEEDSFSFTAPNSQFWESNTDFQIAVNPVNDAPADISLSQNSIAENSYAGKFVAQLTTTDSDSDTHTYTLVDNAGGRFVINENRLKVADGANLDFEIDSSHTIKVRTTDSGEPAQSFEKELVIAVTDVNEAPTDITLSKNTVKENSKTDTLIGKLTTADDSDTHTYTLVKNPGGRFVIEGNKLKVADGANLNFNTNSSHTITVSATDNGEPAQSFEKELVIAVTDVNEAPTDITLSKNTVKENSKTGTLIGKLTTTDSDSDTHTYTLVKNPGGRFVIEGNKLKVADGSKLDFEAATSHTIKIRTADNGSPKKSFSKEFSIAVTDIEDNTVKSTTNYRLGATKENLNLIGKDAINGTGNKLDNRISGNNAKNSIWGKEGNDVLIGRGDNDVLKGEGGKDNLNGGKGNDNLNGGKGRDTMTGGAGNDTFVVDNVKDVVTESAKGGKDLVKSSVSYSLPERVENLTLTGKSAINGTGNKLSNRIVGNDGKNRLNGKGGSDVLIGNGGSDTLMGGGGNDLLDGGVGNDTLIGAGGSDRFLFASPGKDLIRDFKNRDNDKMILDKTTFAALKSKVGKGFSVVAEFDVVKRDAAVASSDAIIVYNENNGKLFYNANGSKSGLGAGGVFAVLDNSPQLQANDFIIRT